MPHKLSRGRHQEVDAELARMQAYLQVLGQEIRDTTAPGRRYNHVWLQADNALAYMRSLRTALQSEQDAYTP
jgi:hypothetical protein